MTAIKLAIGVLFAILVGFGLNLVIASCLSSVRTNACLCDAYIRDRVAQNALESADSQLALGCRPTGLRIGIAADGYEAHLFHDVELFLVAFHQMVEAGHACANVFHVGRSIISSIAGKKYRSKTNLFLIKALFLSDLQSAANTQQNRFDILVDRASLPTRNINKAFASYVNRFPRTAWHHKLRVTTPPHNFAILYVARQLAKKRRLITADDTYLRTLVGKWGGTVVDDLGKLSIEEQIKLFQRHHCVLGLHGNNLTGLMWMRPESIRAHPH